MDTQVADPLIGALLDDRYRIRGRIARGGMATVYRGLDERLDRPIAIKIVHPVAGTSVEGDFGARFAAEARAIARLAHPNVVGVFDHGEHDGLPYLVLEYVPGRTLRDLITERRRLEPAEALGVMSGVLAALAAAHRAGLVHRDVKPENVLLAAEGWDGGRAETGWGNRGWDGGHTARVKVTDFGLARAVEASSEDQPEGQLLATVAYVAPELVSEGHADPRADVYSAGIMLFELLTGRVPFDGPKAAEVAWRHVEEDVPAPSAYAPETPADLDDMVLRATRRDPGARPTDAGAMLAELLSVRDDLGIGPAGDRSTVALPRPQFRTQLLDVRGGNGSRTAADTRHSGNAEHIGHAGTDAAGRIGRAVPPARRGAGSGMAPGPRPAADRPRRRIGIVAVLAGLAVLLAGGAWWFGAGRYTTAPGYVTMGGSEALARAKAAGFDVRTVQGFSETAGVGVVIGQRPVKDTRMLRGGPITLTVSRGPERYTVPSVVGRSAADATRALTALTLRPSATQQYSTKVADGRVISISPKAGTVVRRGAAARLVVSRGPPPVTVPDVAGWSADAAADKLSRAGLTVKAVEQTSDQVARGRVITQSLKAGIGVARRTSITITVSTGPPMVTVPDLTGLGFEDAKKKLEGVGLAASKAFELPLGSGEVHNQFPQPGAEVPKGSTVSLWLL